MKLVILIFKFLPKCVVINMQRETKNIVFNTRFISKQMRYTSTNQEVTGGTEDYGAMRNISR